MRSGETRRNSPSEDVGWCWTESVSMDGATPGPDDGRRTRRKEVTNPVQPRVLVGNLDTGGAAEHALLSHVSGPILRAGTCGMHLSEGRSGHATWHNARAVKLRTAGKRDSSHRSAS